MKIKLGTRGSKLALWQADYVAGKLKEAGINSEIITVKTRGDKEQNKDIASIGSRGVFTKELEDRLEEGEIDVAVHSAKDLESAIGKQFQLLAFTEREEVNDVILSPDPEFMLGRCEPDTLIGTSSVRRKAMLNYYFPHLKTTEARGNLQTRIRKMEEGQFKAMILARAGVERMEYQNYIVQHLPEEQFTPAVGQGSLALEVMKNMDGETKYALYKAVNHRSSELRILAERSFLSYLRGGCSVPVFALAKFEENRLVLDGGIVGLGGSQLIRESIAGPPAESKELGETLAQRVLERGGDQLLEEVKQANQSG